MTIYKPSTYEKPRNLVILLTVATALSASLCGWLGFSIGSTPPRLIVIQIQQPVAHQ